MGSSQPGGRVVAPGRLAVVQSFVNSVNVEFGPDRLDSLDGLRAWAARRHPDVDLAGVTATERRRLVEVREAVRTLLRVNAGHLAPDAPSVAEADATLARVPLAASVVDGVPTVAPTGSGAVLIGSRVVAAALAARAEDSWRRLKVCHDDRCAWAYYDRSRNAGGRWCSMAVCGTRNKMARYRGSA